MKQAFFCLCKSRSNPFLEPTSTKQLEWSFLLKETTGAFLIWFEVMFCCVLDLSATIGVSNNGCTGRCNIGIFTWSTKHYLGLDLILFLSSVNTVTYFTKTSMWQTKFHDSKHVSTIINNACRTLTRSEMYLHWNNQHSLWVNWVMIDIPA